MDMNTSTLESDPAIMADLVNAVEVANEVAPASTVGAKRHRGGVPKKKVTNESTNSSSTGEAVVPPVAVEEAASTKLPQTKAEVAKIEKYLTETIPEEVDNFLAKVLRKVPSIALVAASGAVVKKIALTPGIFSGLTGVVGTIIAAIPSPTWEEVGESYGTMITSLTGFTGNVATWLQTPAGVLFIASMIMRHRAASNNQSVFAQLKSDASMAAGMATEKVKDVAVKAVETVKSEVETGKNVFVAERKRRSSFSAAQALSGIPGVQDVKAANAMVALSGSTGGRRRPRKTKKGKKSKRRVTRRRSTKMPVFAY